MEISTQAAIDAGAQQTELVQVMDQQTVALAGCLKFFMTALLCTMQSTGNTFRYVRVFYDARQLIGAIGNVTGGPANTFDVMIAQDRAKQMAGSIEGTIALDFMNAPSVHNSGKGVVSSKIPLPPMPC